MAYLSWAWTAIARFFWESPYPDRWRVVGRKALGPGSNGSISKRQVSRRRDEVYRATSTMISGVELNRLVRRDLMSGILLPDREVIAEFIGRAEGIVVGEADEGPDPRQPSSVAALSHIEGCDIMDFICQEVTMRLRHSTLR